MNHHPEIEFSFNAVLEPQIDAVSQLGELRVRESRDRGRFCELASHRFRCVEG
jgi:hypothetical protein